ncbi:hypothetical protein [Xenorhabdus griffiniae]|uniref:hypothetical protein n=1 Tax=Xenorhabdus griffiniae TaxID=351672 RepID=UPI00235992B0|nr:hypothetical protein [Xenorhabdus griffiniae]MDC9606087.1 hypothetical protein [Xenorhabdus griffiniae]
MRIDLGIDLDIEIVNHIHRKFVLDLLGWQERWKANQHHRNRFLHKCRQVTLFDDVENRMDKERIAGRLPQQVFEELYLCRLPHPRW